SQNRRCGKRDPGAALSESPRRCQRHEQRHYEVEEHLNAEAPPSSVVRRPTKVHDPKLRCPAQKRKVRSFHLARPPCRPHRATKGHKPFSRQRDKVRRPQSLDPAIEILL